MKITSSSGINTQYNVMVVIFVIFKINKQINK